ncbi:MAG: FliA/WhiG family RNA polymerase sigma factor [Syntrophales bacterium]|nr:FliA/WhiG family RNA polymerase sigma factor [Syntrophales bacterium]
MTPKEREEKIKKYAYLVHNVVNRFITRLPPELASEKEDLINIGIIGLINAVDRFQEEKSTSFEAYATIRIKGAILDELRSRDYMNRGARERRKLVEKAMHDMEKKLGRPPEAEEIADYLGLELEEYYRLIDDSRNVMLIYEDELPETLEGGYNDEEIYEAVDNENPFSILADREMKTQLIEAIKRLPEQEQLVLSLYYNEELTMKEIGKVLSLTESRVSQIHTQAIMRLRAIIHGGKRSVRQIKRQEKPLTGRHIIA